MKIIIATILLMLLVYLQAKLNNKLSSGEFVPKWKYEAYKDEHGKLANIVNKSENPEVKVIINGHRYNIT